MPHTSAVLRTSTMLVMLTGSFVLNPHALADGQRGRTTTQGSLGSTSSRHAVVGDGQGNAAGVSRQRFATDAGTQGMRLRRFSHGSDGSMNASGASVVAGPNGAAERTGSFTRNADGTASAQRDTTVNNANTGVTVDGSATYSAGGGVSRSVTCKDSAGNTVQCGPRR